jgi:alpha-ketoglutarate-dependent taurine dioxygenase
MTNIPTDINQLSEAEKRALLAQLLQQQKSQLFPLSFAQQRLWFLNQLDPEDYAYNIPIAVRLSGELNLAVLEQSLNEIVRRHESLRTTFKTVNNQPVQVITPQLQLAIPVIDLRPRLSQEDETSVIREYAIQEAQTPFNLSKAPLLRFLLLQLNETEHIALLTLHHIISDGWSMGILIRELAALYEAFLQNQPSPLPSLPIQYVDYAVWQREQLQGEKLDRLLNYWRKQLGGSPSSLNLPYDYPIEAAQEFTGGTHSFALPSQQLQLLKTRCQEEGITFFMLLFAAFNSLLYCYTEQEDLVIGTDIANRNRSEVESLIGFFVNILVLRTDLSGNPTFRELLQRIRETALGAYAHQDLPFEKLVEVLKPERKFGQTPLFQVLFVLQNTPLPEFKTTTLKLSSMAVNDQTSKFNLGLFIGEKEGKLVGTWRYRRDLFEPTTIEKIATHFVKILEQISQSPEIRLHKFKTLLQAQHKPAMKSPKMRKGFKKVKPKAIAVSAETLVQRHFFSSHQTLPLVLQPTHPEVDLIPWLQQNSSTLEQDLQQYGAVLLRGFNTHSATDFERVAETICPQLFTEYNDLPREAVAQKVYGATPYPANRPILFHHESAHMHRWPQKIFFFCAIAAQQGGETPLVDGRTIYQKLDPKLHEKFEQKQLMYVRNYVRDLDVPWQQFFHTDNPKVVEEYCRNAGIRFEWKADGTLKTSQISPAVFAHPKTKEKIFFNQIQLHHPACLDAEVKASLLSLFPVEDFPRNVLYGDGTLIENDVMAEICQLYKQEQHGFLWQEGDILVVDNMLVAHGRNPYVGARKTLVTMGDIFENR